MLRLSLWLAVAAILPVNAIAAPVHDAASAGDLESIEHYVDGGGDPNVRDPNGLTPLHVAAYEGRRNVVEYLVRHRADVASQGPRDQKPLTMAAKSGQVTTAEVLLANGADVNARDADDATPLYWAARFNHPDMVALLLAAGARPNDQDRTGQAPLHLAAGYGFGKVVHLLVEGGAHTLLYTSQDMTPAMLAANSGHDLIVGVLHGKPPSELRGRDDPDPLDAADTVKVASLLSKLGYLRGKSKAGGGLEASTKAFQQTQLFYAVNGKTSTALRESLALVDEQVMITDNQGKKPAANARCRYRLTFDQSTRAVIVVGGCRAGADVKMLDVARSRLPTFAQAVVTTNDTVTLQFVSATESNAIWLHTKNSPNN